ncbi:MAG: DUF3021 domain-containing protein [Ruminococcaceae bacterium]|nr:DUF3021 domain-containing protein [Oscillospiraceae bacterium]
MNRYVKEFLHRGLLFGGFGPIVVGIVLAIIDTVTGNISLHGTQILLSIVSSYLLAFVQAGSTVFEQIEHWSTVKSVFFHFLSLYVVYVGCYLLNSWIPFEKTVVLIFTCIFAVGFFAIWGIVVVSVKIAERKLNKVLHKTF